MNAFLKYFFPPASLVATDVREQTRFILLLIFIFFLPFDILYSNILLFLIIATTLLDLRKEKFKQVPKQFWIFQAIYFLSVIGYFYSWHRGAAGFLLERQLTILLMPLLLPLAVEITETRKRWILHSFSLSSVLVILFLFANAFLMVKKLHTPWSSIFSKEFFNHRFSAPIGIHAGYLSLYVSLCIFHLLQLFMEKPRLRVRLILIAALLILFSGLFFLASRNTLISTFLIICLVFPAFYIRRKLRFVIGMVVLLCTGFLLINTIPYLKKRFTSEFVNDIHSARNTMDMEGTEPRIERWKGGLELFKNSPLIGYGTGDEIPMLKVAYIKHDLYISYLEEFNAHNEYLSYLLKNGLIGFVVFLFAFGYYMYIAILKKDFIYCSFLLLLLIGFCTENILDANKGILFFAFLNTFFGYNALKYLRAKSAQNAYRRGFFVVTLNYFRTWQ